MAICLPPQSFSIRESDPNYCPAWRAAGPSFEVFLNGSEVRKVTAYDCAAGWVRHLAVDEDGKFQLDLEAGVAVETTDHGVVEACWNVPVLTDD